MAVDKTAALLATLIFYGAGHLLCFIDKKVIEATSDVVFGTFKRLGADEERRRIEEDEQDGEKADEVFMKLVRAASSECPDFEPPPVQVIDGEGKKTGLIFVLNTFFIIPYYVGQQAR